MLVFPPKMLAQSRKAYTPTSNTASHDNHEKINSWVFFTFLYGYGAPLGGPVAAGDPLKCILPNLYSDIDSAKERVVGHRLQHSNRYSISTRAHVLSYIYFFLKHLSGPES